MLFATLVFGAGWWAGWLTAIVQAAIYDRRPLTTPSPTRVMREADDVIRHSGGSV